MANTLKIKRSDTSPAAAPTALARGELAYQEVSNILYIGSGNETGGEAANRPVVAGPLNFMPAPTANVSLNSKRITSLAAPTSANDAATKAYVDAAKTGLDVKDSVRVASTAAISGFPDLSSAPTIDGVTLQDQDRVLIKDEGTASNNGIWVWNNSGTIFSRAADADNSPSGEVTSGMFTFVEEGSVNADSGWVLTTNGAITLGSTSLAFAQFSGAGQITAGNGLQKVGNTLSTDLKANGGIEIDSGELRIDLSDSGIAASGVLAAASVATSAVADGGANLATGDQIHTFVTGLGYITASSTNTLTNTTIDCGTF